MTTSTSHDTLTDLHKLSLSREQALMKKARRLGAYMDRMYREGEKEGEHCGQLLLGWGKDCFWGKMVVRHLSYFDQLWEWLNERKHHSSRTGISLGDVDYSVWIEKPKDECTKVIISTCHCRCCDDNTTVFIRTKYDAVGLLSSLGHFNVVTVWPKEKKSKYGPFGDHRDIDLPSLNTYRKENWEWGYRDNRDKGHVLKYEAMFERVDGARHTEGRIQLVLDELKWLVSETKQTER